MRTDRRGLSLLVPSFWAVLAGCNHTPPPPPVEQNAYTCSCDCPSVGVVDVPTCVAAAGATLTQQDFEDNCNDVVCPAGTLLLDELGDVCLPIPAIAGQCQPANHDAADNPVTHGVSNITSNVECDVPCDIIPCATDLSNFNTCTQTSTDNPNCAATSDPFCRPPPGDPPTLNGGMMATLAGNQSRGFIDPGSSTATVDVGNQSEVTSIRGVVTLEGEPCPGTTCSVLVGLDLFGADFQIGGHDVTDVTVNGGTKPHLVSLDATGHGVMGVGDVQATFIARIDGDKTGFVASNVGIINVDVDWTTGAVHVYDGFSFTPDSGPTIGVRTDIHATLVNQPPKANAGGDVEAECTSPTGTEVTLDGSGSSDPDGANDIISYRWYDADQTLLGESPAEAIEAPLGESVYSLLVTDGSFQMDRDTVTVNVEDTTPPGITGAAASQTCLWPPDHQMALFELGTDLTIDAADACQPDTVTYEIVDVTSNEPDNGLGDGDTSGDIRLTADTVCLRSERQGPGEDRVYTVTLRASDASGNAAETQLEVVVPHDQSNGGGGPACSPSEYHDLVFVDDDDPRCGTSADPAPEEKSHEGGPHTDEARGCSTVPEGPVGSTLLAVGLAGLLARRRRLGIAAALVIGGCAKGPVSGDVNGQALTFSDGYACVRADEVELALHDGPIDCGAVADRGLYSLGVPPTHGSYDLILAPPEMRTLTAFIEGESYVFSSGTVRIDKIDAATVSGDMSAQGFGDLNGTFTVPVCACP